MENLILFLATSLIIRLSFPPKIKNRIIGDTGCSALLAAEDELEFSPTQSGDHLYFHEFHDKNVSYGMICIEMKNESDLGEAEEMLRAYVDKLKGPLRILHSTGIDDEADWNTEAAKTIVDYWQDYQKKDWKIKGYTNGKTIAVLYVKNIGQADVKKQDLFLDSFHFSTVC